CAQDFALFLQRREEFGDRRAQFRRQSILVALHLGAHPINDLRQMCVYLLVRDALSRQSGAQDTGVGIAVELKAFQANFKAKNFTDGVLKGEVMNAITTIQQSSIDVEQVSASRIPLEARAHAGRPSSGGG